MTTDISAFAIDKTLVRAAFNGSAPRYDSVAVLQREVNTRMQERLELVKIQPDRILDLGSGTGQGSAALKARYKTARVISLDLAFNMLKQAKAKHKSLLPWRNKQTLVCGDCEALPFANNSADMIFSNLTFQWCQQLDTVFQECHRVLKPGGLLMFTTFGPDTLRELRQSWQQADRYNHVNAFIDMHDIGDSLIRGAFETPVMDVEHISLTYSDVMQLMRELKTLGAHNITAGRSPGLTGRGQLRTMMNAYESYRRDGLLPATYEVVYGHAWKGLKPATRNPDGSATVDISQLISHRKRV